MTIDDFFTPDELDAFENLSLHSSNIEELRKTGNVTITKEELDNGYISETISYESFDGKTSFTRFNSYPKVDEKSERIKAIDSIIDSYVAKEDYENAAKYRDMKEALLN